MKDNIIYSYGRPENNRSIIVTTIPYPPWLYKTTKNEFTGAMFHALMAMVERLHLNFSLMFTEDGWGLYKNGNWTGMAGSLIYDRANISVGPFSLSAYRAQAMDFSSVFTEDYLTVLAGKKDKDQHTDMFRTLLVFDWEVWIGVASSMILIILLCSIIDSKRIGRKKSSKKKSFVAILGKYFIAVVANFFYEGSTLNVMTDSIRLLLGVWLLVITVIMNAFSSQLKAALLIKPEGERINYISDIIRKPWLEPVFHCQTVYEKMLREDRKKSEVIDKLWIQIDKHKSCKGGYGVHNFENIKKVQEGKSVIIADMLTLKQTTGMYCRQLPEGNYYFAKDSFLHSYFVWGLNKRMDEKLKRDIRKYSQLMRESGLFDHWFKKYSSNWDLCTIAASNTEKPLYLNSMIGIFILWTICLGISFLAFLMERIYFKTCKRSTKLKPVHIRRRK